MKKCNIADRLTTSSNYPYGWVAVAKWLRCLPRNLRIVGSNPTRITTMIPHIPPVLVGSRKRTRGLFKEVVKTCFTIEQK